MIKKIKEEIVQFYESFKDSIKKVAILLVVLLIVFLTSRCYGQYVYVGVKPFVPMTEGETDVKIDVGVDYNLGKHFIVGAEMTYTPSSKSKGGVSVYNAVGSCTDRWSMYLKGHVGAEHIFTDEQTDHSYIVYGVGLRVTRLFDMLGVYVEPSMNWNTYSAHISPSAERGWIGICAGMSIRIGR